MKHWLLYLILISIALLTGCSSEKALLNSENSCIPPCWHNIQPGVTSSEQTLILLSGSKEIFPKSILRKGNSWNSFSDVIYFSLNSTEEGQIYFFDDKVMLIEFTGIRHITFSNLISKFGEPEKIIKYFRLGPGFLFGDGLHLIISGISPELGIAYGFDSYNRIQSNQLKPNSQVSFIDYFYPSDFAKLAELGMFTDGFDLKQTMIYEWNG